MSPKPVLLLLFLSAVLSACSDPVARPSIAVPVLRFDTADRRNAAARAVQDAWRQRPRATTDGNRRAERRFLKALGSYLAHIQRTPEFVAACVLWNDCVRDHTQQYGEIEG